MLQGPLNSAFRKFSLALGVCVCVCVCLYVLYLGDYLTVWLLYLSLGSRIKYTWAICEKIQRMKKSILVIIAREPEHFCPQIFMKQVFHSQRAWRFWNRYRSCGSEPRL
jgi:hypothetical protein